MVPMVMNSVIAAAPAISKRMPALADAVKQRLPQVYDKVASIMAATGATPASVAAKAASTGNAQLTSGLLETFVRYGTPADLVRQIVPLVSEGDIKTLAQQFADLEKLERDVTNAAAPKFEGDPVVLATQNVVQIERLCKYLGVTSNQLEELITGFHVLSPKQIADYQKLKLAIGQRPV